jgi:hypothetical protein
MPSKLTTMFFTLSLLRANFEFGRKLSRVGASASILRAIDLPTLEIEKPKGEATSAIMTQLHVKLRLVRKQYM